jgi:hypothetical protein
MKHRTKFGNNGCPYEVYFAYEDYFGGDKFGSYDDMQENGEIPNIENNNGMLVGYLHSFYWGVTERIDMINLKGKPTISEIKTFMEECYKCLEKI